MKSGNLNFLEPSGPLQACSGTALLRNVLPSEIHHQICQVYGDNAMSDGMVRKWVRIFNERWENVHDEARSGRPSLVNDYLVRKVNERVHDNGRFTISDLSLQFPQILRTLLYDIVSSG